MFWTIDLLKKSFDDQILNSVKNCYLILFQLKATFLSLLHADIGIGNKIVYTYFDWISQRIEFISDEELSMTIRN